MSQKNPAVQFVCNLTSCLLGTFETPASKYPVAGIKSRAHDNKRAVNNAGKLWGCWQISEDVDCFPVRGRSVHKAPLAQAGLSVSQIRSQAPRTTGRNYLVVSSSSHNGECPWHAILLLGSSRAWLYPPEDTDSF
ncbi:unnamed protein product [[Candida] boidinii]|nr:unnamed protein product [[Candida] boidinii]